MTKKKVPTGIDLNVMAKNSAFPENMHQRSPEGKSACQKITCLRMPYGLISNCRTVFYEF